MSVQRYTSARGEFAIRDGVDFDCAFCKGRCTVSLERQCVVHTEPACERFYALEPDEFLYEVNKVNAERKRNAN